MSGIRTYKMKVVIDTDCIGSYKMKVLETLIKSCYKMKVLETLIKSCYKMHSKMTSLLYHNKLID